MSNPSKVGYKNPPQHTRFKKGRSGNPKGRPKEIKVPVRHLITETDMNQTFFKVASQMIVVMKNGKSVEMSKLEALVENIINDGIKGNHPARKEVLQRLERASKKETKVRNEFLVDYAKMKERVQRSSASPGSYKHLLSVNSYFGFKRDIRRLEGLDMWPYETDEPVTDEDWHLLWSHLERLHADPKGKPAPWPLDYPSEKAFNTPPVDIAE